MTTPDGRVAVAFNGEIYNAPALRRELESAGVTFQSTGDTEVLIHAVARWGVERALDALRGMFAFVLWDTRPMIVGGRPVLIAAIDHAGMKPLYLHHGLDGLAIASTADALRDLLPEHPALDGTSLCHILSLGYCPAPRTVWRGVSKLEPGHWFRWSPGDPAPISTLFWTPPTELDAGTDARERREEFAEIWPRVVEDHLVGDVPVSLLLSGGLDSTALAVALANLHHLPACLTLGLPGADDESAAAADTARFLGLAHSATALAAADAPSLLQEAAAIFDEPQGFGALLTMTRVARAARAHSKVVLAGDGGDEAFAGYAWHRPTPRRSILTQAAHVQLARAVARPDAAPQDRAAALDALASLSFVHEHLVNVMPRFHPNEAAALLAPLEPIYDEDVLAGWLAPHDNPRLPDLRRRQRLDLRGFCAGSILPKVDRATMGVGLELRAPFLDRRVLDWALRRPVETDADRLEPKQDLRDFLRGRAPASVLSRKKQGFSLRLGRSDVFTGLLDEAVAESRLVREGVVCKAWRSYVAPGVPHREGRAFALAMLAAWWETRA